MKLFINLYVVKNQFIHSIARDLSNLSFNSEILKNLEDVLGFINIFSDFITYKNSFQVENSYFKANLNEFDENELFKSSCDRETYLENFRLFKEIHCKLSKPL